MELAWQYFSCPQVEPCAFGRCPRWGLAGGRRCILEPSSATEPEKYTLRGKHLKDRPWCSNFKPRSTRCSFLTCDYFWSQWQQILSECNLSVKYGQPLSSWLEACLQATLECRAEKSIYIHISSSPFQALFQCWCLVGISRATACACCLFYFHYGPPRTAWSWPLCSYILGRWRE